MFVSNIDGSAQLHVYDFAPGNESKKSTSAQLTSTAPANQMVSGKESDKNKTTAEGKLDNILVNECERPDPSQKSVAPAEDEELDENLPPRADPQHDSKCDKPCYSKISRQPQSPLTAQGRRNLLHSSTSGFSRRFGNCLTNASNRRPAEQPFAQSQ